MKTSLTRYDYPTREAASAAVAEAAATALKHAIDAKGRASIALSGGNTPGQAMQLLSQQQVNWSCVTAGLVDERFVAPDHEGSNEGLVRRLFLQGGAREASFLSMYGDGKSPEQSAAQANLAYKTNSPFDFVLLGMGGDGHTASWFPNTEDLGRVFTSPETVIAIDSEDVAGARGFRHRLTLTRSAIEAASQAIILLFGEDRKETFFNSIEFTPNERPVKAAIDALGDRLVVVCAP